jgi:hypothetical protein
MRISVVFSQSDRIIALDVAPSMAMGTLKRMIAEQARVPATTLALSVRGRRANDSQTLQSCGAQDDEVVQVEETR